MASKPIAGVGHNPNPKALMRKGTLAIAMGSMAIIVVVCWLYFAERTPEPTGYVPQGPQMKQEGLQPTSKPSPTASASKSPAIDAPDKPEVAPDKDTLGYSLPIPAIPGSTGEFVEFMMAIARHPEIDITKEELEAMLQIYIETTKQRTEFESSICTVETTDEGTKVITIPEYSEAGVLIYRKLFEQFSEVVGNDRSTELEALVGPQLYVSNFGFGDAEQKIQISLNKDIPFGAHFSFVHSMGPLSVIVYDPETDATTPVELRGKETKSSHELANVGSYISFLKHFPLE